MSADASERRLYSALMTMPIHHKMDLLTTNPGLYLALQHWLISNAERVRDTIVAQETPRLGTGQEVPPP